MDHDSEHADDSPWWIGLSKAEAVMLVVLLSYAAAGVLSLLVFGLHGLMVWALLSAGLGGLWILTIAIGKVS